MGIRKSQLNQPTLQTMRGFSLVEVLVSLSIFTVVVTISVGTLLVLIDANAKSQSMQIVMSNLATSLDSMTREIRMGDSYYCGLTTSSSATQDCPSGGSAFSFREGGTARSLTRDLNSSRIAYRFHNDAIQRRLGDSSDWSGDGWTQITSPQVVIEDMRFVVTGSGRVSIFNTNTEAPTVTMFIEGRVVLGDIDTAFNIQTTVTQQILNFGI